MFKRFKNIFRNKSNNKYNINVNQREANVNPEEHNNNDSSLVTFQETSADENNKIENYKILQVEIKGYNPKDIFNETTKVSIYFNGFSEPRICGISDFVNVIATLEEELRSINNDSASREIDNNAQLLKQVSWVLKYETKEFYNSKVDCNWIRRKSFEMQGDPSYFPWDQILEVSQEKENQQTEIKSLISNEKFASLVESKDTKNPWFKVNYLEPEIKSKEQRSLTF